MHTSLTRRKGLFAVYHKPGKIGLSYITLPVLNEREGMDVRSSRLSGLANRGDNMRQTQHLKLHPKHSRLPYLDDRNEAALLTYAGVPSQVASVHRDCQGGGQVRPDLQNRSPLGEPGTLKRVRKRCLEILYFEVGPHPQPNPSTNSTVPDSGPFVTVALSVRGSNVRYFHWIPYR